MDENPYQSPRELGYHPPRPGLDAEDKDTIALWITGTVCSFALVAINLFIQWLLGNFPSRT